MDWRKWLNWPAPVVREASIELIVIDELSTFYWPKKKKRKRAQQVRRSLR